MALIQKHVVEIDQLDIWNHNEKQQKLWEALEKSVTKHWGRFYVTAAWSGHGSVCL